MKKILAILFMSLTIGQITLFATDPISKSLCKKSELSNITSDRYFYVGESKSYPLILADTKSIQIDENEKIIKVWTFWYTSAELRKMHINGMGNSYKNYGYDKQLILLDYKNMLNKNVTTINYTCDGNSIQTYDNSHLGWKDIVPNSVMEAIAHFIIEKYDLK